MEVQRLRRRGPVKAHPLRTVQRHDAEHPARTRIGRVHRDRVVHVLGILGILLGMDRDKAGEQRQEGDYRFFHAYFVFGEIFYLLMYR